MFIIKKIIFLCVITYKNISFFKTFMRQSIVTIFTSSIKPQNINGFLTVYIVFSYTINKEFEKGLKYERFRNF
jgi:hypothetical protein